MSYFSKGIEDFEDKIQLLILNKTFASEILGKSIDLVLREFKNIDKMIHLRNVKV